MLENILTDNQRTCNIMCVPGWTDEQRDSDMARGIGGIERDEKVFRIESEIAKRHWHYLSQQTRCCSAHGRRAALQCSRPPGCSRAEVRLICPCRFVGAGWHPRAGSLHSRRAEKRRSHRQIHLLRRGRRRRPSIAKHRRRPLQSDERRRYSC